MDFGAEGALPAGPPPGKGRSWSTGSEAPRGAATFSELALCRGAPTKPPAPPPPPRVPPAATRRCGSGAAPLCGATHGGVWGERAVSKRQLKSGVAPTERTRRAPLARRSCRARSARRRGRDAQPAAVNGGQAWACGGKPKPQRTHHARLERRELGFQLVQRRGAAAGGDAASADTPCGRAGGGASAPRDPRLVHLARAGEAAAQLQEGGARRVEQRAVLPDVVVLRGVGGG